MLFNGSFVVVGIGMMSILPWAYWEGGRTVYAVTDKRVIILVAGRSVKVQSYGRVDTNSMARTERADGTGDLVVAKKDVKDSDSKGGTRTVDVKFVGIPEVRLVESIIKETFNHVHT